MNAATAIGERADRQIGILVTVPQPACRCRGRVQDEPVCARIGLAGRPAAASCGASGRGVNSRRRGEFPRQGLLVPRADLGHRDTTFAAGGRLEHDHRQRAGARGEQARAPGAQHCPISSDLRTAPSARDPQSSGTQAQASHRSRGTAAGTRQASPTAPPAGGVTSELVEATTLETAVVVVVSGIVWLALTRGDGRSSAPVARVLAFQAGAGAGEIVLIANTLGYGAISLLAPLLAARLWAVAGSDLAITALAGSLTGISLSSLLIASAPAMSGSVGGYTWPVVAGVMSLLVMSAVGDRVSVAERRTDDSNSRHGLLPRALARRGHERWVTLVAAAAGVVGGLAGAVAATAVGLSWPLAVLVGATTFGVAVAAAAPTVLPTDVRAGYEVMSWILARMERRAPPGALPFPRTAAEAERWLARHAGDPSVDVYHVEFTEMATGRAVAGDMIDKLPETTAFDRFMKVLLRSHAAWLSGADVDITELREAAGDASLSADERLEVQAMAACEEARARAAANDPDWTSPLLSTRAWIRAENLSSSWRQLFVREFRNVFIIGVAASILNAPLLRQLDGR